MPKGKIKIKTPDLSGGAQQADSTLFGDLRLIFYALLILVMVLSVIAPDKVIPIINGGVYLFAHVLVFILTLSASVVIGIFDIINIFFPSSFNTDQMRIEAAVSIAQFIYSLTGVKP